MNQLAWIKPGLTGVVVGAVGLAIVGFAWGGWVTGGTAEARASDREKIAAVNALVPFCVARAAGGDAGAPQTMTELRDAKSYQHAEILMKAGWATPPGAEAADRELAKACAVKLALAT